LTRRDEKIARAFRDERTCTNWPQMDALAMEIAALLGLKGKDVVRFFALSRDEGREC
jgi:hypothetical protein